jgi:outer membrane protein OmpA-like peptidoglycan-associated protein
MVKYRLTKKGKVVVVLLCSFMMLSVTLGVSLSKEKSMGYADSNLDNTPAKPISMTQPPTAAKPQTGQAEKSIESVDATKVSIFFDANAVSLSNEYSKDLDAFLKTAAQYEHTKIQIEGNCATLFDNSKSKGQNSANYDLSLRRAQAVADYFKDKGINSDRLVVVANGSEKPLKDNDTPAGREYNRRVDVFFLNK